MTRPVTQCLDTYQLGAVSGEEVRLQRDFKTVNRLLGTNVICDSRYGFVGNAGNLELDAL